MQIQSVSQLQSLPIIRNSALPPEFPKSLSSNNQTYIEASYYDSNCGHYSSYKLNLNDFCQWIFGNLSMLNDKIDYLSAKLERDNDALSNDEVGYMSKINTLRNELNDKANALSSDLQSDYRKYGIYGYNYVANRITATMNRKFSAISSYGYSQDEGISGYNCVVNNITAGLNHKFEVLSSDGIIDNVVGYNKRFNDLSLLLSNKYDVLSDVYYKKLIEVSTRIELSIRTCDYRYLMLNNSGGQYVTTQTTFSNTINGNITNANNALTSNYAVSADIANRARWA